ncbi:hypothetical protein LNP04_17350 [Chryseobacterium sp. C-71]|uniref:ISAon1 family transposase N-terminal region protein n=1 Tax=Chryseobacterium sp. C-71 TaxID=2893882 RepID=UPI001E40FC64|nr:hypothetical protein [Chryseobacterium sp. C-71]UFH31709.1 hypothetical protein LNP04_17350 [Chryseobacterium sp. C-71]
MFSEQELLKFLLLPYLVEYFDIVKCEEKESLPYLYFKEKSTIPKEFSSHQLQSKGFYETITVDDFPLRGKPVKPLYQTQKMDGY